MGGIFVKFSGGIMVGWDYVELVVNCVEFEEDYVELGDDCVEFGCDCPERGLLGIHH